ncbi:MAG: VOC family protein [Alicyclobacillus macrosporangiidus]|uniref:VOC family protein n=1 Tax=Alicyclobacillus macrosporangiidus TaxID=392015 RepID=UPI0026F31019|nr:VOC family protein [Alicyclobacillus macrosporangiidus]MCL6600542.1 VOC family protein [Alicyclobacillus macrosporangiidus]
MIKGLYEAHLPVNDIEISIEFYRGLGLELAYVGPRVTFFWIEKGKSWLGLWPSDHVKTPYHPSIRHVAFYVELEDLKRAQMWLKSRGIEVRDAFGVVAEDQPLILKNDVHYHASIFFNDPDGNSLEFISPLKLDAQAMTYEDGMTLEQWLAANNL